MVNVAHQILDPLHQLDITSHSRTAQVIAELNVISAGSRDMHIGRGRSVFVSRLADNLIVPIIDDVIWRHMDRPPRAMLVGAGLSGKLPGCDRALRPAECVPGTVVGFDGILRVSRQSFS